MLKVNDIVKKVGGTLIKGESGALISGVASIEKAEKEDITFIGNEKYISFLATTAAGAVLIPTELQDAEVKEGVSVIATDNPSLAFSAVIDALYPPKKRTALGVHPTAVVDEDVVLGANVAIGPNAVIEAGVVIGDNTQVGAGSYIGSDAKIGTDCELFPNVTVMDRMVLGNRVIIHSSAVIGSDGFGFAEEGNNLQKIPQVGIVLVEDDVEIGSNVSIDRARFDKTIIGSGTKIDNLVQIAHNVEIGRNCRVVSQAGISGSTKLGNNVILAGQSGLVGHINVGDNVVLAARGVFTKNIDKPGIYSGFPAIPHGQEKRKSIMIAKLPQMAKQLKGLLKKFEDTDKK